MPDANEVEQNLLSLISDKGQSQIDDIDISQIEESRSNLSQPSTAPHRIPDSVERKTLGGFPSLQSPS